MDNITAINLLKIPEGFKKREKWFDPKKFDSVWLELILGEKQKITTSIYNASNEKYCGYLQLTFSKSQAIKWACTLFNP